MNESSSAEFRTTRPTLSARTAFWSWLRIDVAVAFATGPGAPPNRFEPVEAARAPRDVAATDAALLKANEAARKATITHAPRREMLPARDSCIRETSFAAGFRAPGD